jgi:hypothetical protein
MTHTMLTGESARHKRLIFRFFHSIRPFSALPFGALNSELAVCLEAIRGVRLSLQKVQNKLTF